MRCAACPERTLTRSHADAVGMVRGRMGDDARGVAARARPARQNQRLRSADATIPWELEQRKGAVHRCEQLGMYQLLHKKGYPFCGIEVAWTKCTIHPDHPRVASSDDFCLMMAGLIANLTLEHVRRNLCLTRAYPRRQ
eukprot:9032920-Pyramimonas_sp.AAC.1